MVAHRTRKHAHSRGRTLHTSPLETLERRQLLSAATAATVISPNLTASPLAGSSSSFSGYTPAQIKAAYGFSSISGDGTGQTIAIVDAYSDPNIAADLKAFDAKYGIKDTTLNVYGETGGSASKVQASKDWSAEIALDVEWAHAIAPGATIDLVEASSASTNDLLTAVKTAASLKGVSVVSMSWGSSEFASETKYDSYFTTPTGHQGVTFVAAAGDDGTTSAEWPASSPNVLSVGGTTLNLTSTGTYSSESTWSDTTGGVSSYEKAPSYQSAVSGTTTRSTPDVSYDADPNTGFAIYDSYGSGGWTVVGGTSAGAPQWAALVALADQVRVSNGLGTLDGATGTLPAIYASYGSSATSASYTAAFHDVTTGSNGSGGGGGSGLSGFPGGGGGFGGFPGGGFPGRGRRFDVTASPDFGGRFGGRSSGISAATGYDEVTGLGTPKAATLIADLASYKVASSSSTKATTKSTTTTTTRSSRASAARMTHASVALIDGTPVVASAPQQVAPAVLAALVADRTAAGTAGGSASRSVIAAADGESAAVGATTTTSVATSGPVQAGAAGSRLLSTSFIGGAAETTAVPGVSMATLNDLLADTAATTISSAARVTMIDATAAFYDAMNAFAHEATDAVGWAAMVPAALGDAHGVALGTTLAVLAADAVLIGQWLSTRYRPTKTARGGGAPATFGLVPVAGGEGLED